MQGIKYSEAEHKNQSEKHEEKNVVQSAIRSQEENLKMGDTDQCQMLQSQGKWWGHLPCLCSTDNKYVE